MARPEGAGRKKGTPNKKTQALHDIALARGIDIFDCLLMVAAGDYKGLGYDSDVYHAEKPDGSVKMGFTIPVELRFQAMKEAAKYLYPQRKAIEHSSDEDTGFKIIIKDYISKEKK